VNQAGLRFSPLELTCRSFEAEPDEVDCSEERCHRNCVEQDLLAFSKNEDRLVCVVEALYGVINAFVDKCDFIARLGGLGGFLDCGFGFGVFHNGCCFIGWAD